MRAENLMTAKLVTVSPDASVIEAAELMLQHQVGGLPVVDASGTLVGMITSGDLLRRTEIGTEARRGGFAEFQAGHGRIAADYAKAHGKQVVHTMTTALHTVGADAPITEKIVDMMDRHNVKQVPVIQQGRLVGLVSRTDILRAFVKTARQSTEEVCDDSEIRRRLFCHLHAQILGAIGQHRHSSPKRHRRACRQRFQRSAKARIDGRGWVRTRRQVGNRSSGFLKRWSQRLPLT